MNKGIVPSGIIRKYNGSTIDSFYGAAIIEILRLRNGYLKGAVFIRNNRFYYYGGLAIFLFERYHVFARDEG